MLKFRPFVESKEFFDNRIVTVVRRHTGKISDLRFDEWRQIERKHTQGKFYCASAIRKVRVRIMKFS